MQYSAFQFVVNKIAKVCQAGLSVFLLLNLALLHAIASPISAKNAAPAFSQEIQSTCYALQRELPRINLQIGNQTASSNSGDATADAAIFLSAIPHFNKVLLSVSNQLDANSSNGRYVYFLPEPRAAPQA